MYNLVRPILFQLDPELAHDLALKSLSVCHRLGLSRFLTSIPSSLPINLFGLNFPNRIGLAAGMDKNADYIDALASLGFGFIEIGTVTPQPQIGNPRPRLFRLIQEDAIINRMGFNGKGLDYVVKRLEKTKYKGILGINIGKNKITPNEEAVKDYLICFQRLWRYASYITVNISSPNTANLRDLQQADSLNQLLSALKQEQKLIETQHKKYVPLLVKISPDLSLEQLNEMADIFLEQKIDGVIATNTTVRRDNIQHSLANETGGLSGKPLHDKNTQIIRQLHNRLQKRLPIIAAGGIMDEKSAKEKLEAGADLLQLFTGFVYSGPSLIKQLVATTKSTAALA